MQPPTMNYTYLRNLMKRAACLFDLLNALTQTRHVFIAVKRILCFHIKWQTILPQYRFHKHIDRNRNIHPSFITKFFKSAFVITVHTNAKGSLCHSIILHRVVLTYIVYHTPCYFVNTVCGILYRFLFGFILQYPYRCCPRLPRFPFLPYPSPYPRPLPPPLPYR